MKKRDDRVPYTYLIGWSDQNKWYYGARWAKGCHPDDLWVKYFTSSKNVSRFREEFGDPDVVEVTDTFNTIEQAKEWESIIIRLNRIVESEDFLNLRDPQTQFQCVGGWLLSKEEKMRRSEKFKGEGNPMYGKHYTDEERRKMSESRTGRKVVFSEQAIENIRMAAAKRKRFYSPEERYSRSVFLCKNNPMENEKSRLKISAFRTGKIWITNGECTMAIDQNDVIPNGFRRGKTNGS
jgi:hypothetical protein